MPSSRAAGEPSPRLEAGPILRTRLVWLTAFRTVATSLLLAAVAGRLISTLPKELSRADTLSFAAIGVVYLFTLAFALRLRRGTASRVDAAVQVAADVVIATGLVFLTGGPESPFTFAYSLAVIGAAVVLDARGTWLAAIASALAYSGVLLVVQVGVVVSPIGASPLSVGRAGFLLASNVLAVTLIGVLASYQSGQLQDTGGRLSAREADLRTLGELHRQILAAMPSGLITCSLEGRVTFVNRAARAILGLDGDISEGVNLDALIPGALALKPGARRVELTLQTQLGQRTLGLSLVAMPAEASGMLVVFQDLTELRHMEEALRRTDRLAALGTMAAQLAHEIRNPLAAMSGSAQMIANDGAGDESSAKLARILLRESNRLSRLVEDFLSFARPPAPQRRAVDLGALLSETVGLLKLDPLARLVQVDVAAATLLGSVDPDQMRQVLLNLVRNALQAAGPSGRVRVGLERDAERACISVWDSAGGISPALMPRLFEPFFTTREGGTGLGLATAHSIVTAHGGTIRVTSGRREGTEFKVLLPMDALQG